jgi:hypothetical protein
MEERHFVAERAQCLRQGNGFDPCSLAVPHSPRRRTLSSATGGPLRTSALWIFSSVARDVSSTTKTVRGTLKSASLVLHSVMTCWGKEARSAGARSGRE